MQLTTTAKMLTSEYQDGTLKEDNYYITIASGAPKVATYHKPTAAERAYRSANNLPAPQPHFHCEGVLMQGALKTIAVLARVPSYDQLTEEQKNELKS